MAGKRAGIGAAIVVLAAALGLLVVVGIILLMMWRQPGIQHSPGPRGSIGKVDSVSELAMKSRLTGQTSKSIRGDCTIWRPACG